MHFGTFRLTTEGIDEPARALKRTNPGGGTVATSSFGTLGFGESFQLT